LLICILYAPNVARLVLYTECTLQITNAQQCDCNFSNLPADQQANFPEKQKEIQQQTDWKYLIAEKTASAGALMATKKTYALCNNIIYHAGYTGSIFRPPCLTA